MKRRYRGIRRWLLAGILVLTAFLAFGCVENSGGLADNGRNSLAVESGTGISAGENESQKLQTEEGSRPGTGKPGEEKPEKQDTEADEEGPGADSSEKKDSALEELTVSEDGEYILKEEVALYLHKYGHLPGNYITKKEAQKLGWDNQKGNLSEVAPGKSIGGSRFGNYEKTLPEKKGRNYYECDLGYEDGYRGAERLVYSDDGLIFYTEDHYQTFEQLYP